MKLITTILLAALSFFASAQVSKVELSDPIDLPKFGWNKVLLMKNGNTVLFHFELRRSILVKVFDRDHKEIASQKCNGKLIDVNALDRTLFHEVADINGEAVVFMTQEIENKTTFVRLRFSALDGTLIAEDKVIQSESFKKRIEAHLLKRPDADEYAVFGFKDLELNPNAEMKLTRYNKDHTVLKELPLDIKMGDYDYVKFAGTAIDSKGGIQITILYSKIIQFPDNIDREIVIYYLAPAAEYFVAKKIKLPNGLYPAITAYTCNPFANSLNLVMKSVRIMDIKNVDFKKLKQVFYPSMLLVTGSDMNAFSSTALTYTKANEYLKLNTDTMHKFNGDITSMHTNQRGLTTIISEANNWEKGMKGDIAITQCDDVGGELWATLIPKAHFNREEKGPAVFGYELNAELDDHKAFYSGNSIYVLFNDIDKNFNNQSLEADSVYSYSHTNGLFYKVDRKRELSKGYLFGTPSPDESKVCCIGSSVYDDKTNVFSSLIMHREGEKSNFKLAWCYLEP